MYDVLFESACCREPVTRLMCAMACREFVIFSCVKKAKSITTQIRGSRLERGWRDSSVVFVVSSSSIIAWKIVVFSRISMSESISEDEDKSWDERLLRTYKEK